MKDKKDKHKHHESTIGKIIYGFLLFAPLLAIAVTCGYAIFNKNAYKSFLTTDYIQSISTVSTSNQLIDNSNYVFQYKTWQEHNYNSNNEWQTGKYIIGERIYLNSSTINWEKYFSDELIEQIDSVKFQTQNLISQLRITIYDVNNTQLALLASNNYWDIFNENTYLNIKAITNPTTLQNGLSLITEKIASINDVFYTATKQVEESTLFNWSKNTAIYTVLNNTSNTLGITNTFWPMLMAYWLIISVIYILYDIVLMMLVIFHRKVHCLQDSI